MLRVHSVHQSQEEHLAIPAISLEQPVILPYQDPIPLVVICF